MTESEVSKAVAQAIESAQAIEFDPRKWLEIVLSRIASQHYPNAARETAAASLIRGIAAPFGEMLRAWDIAGIRRLLAELERDCRELARPIPRGARSPAMNNIGWLSQECDFLGHAGNDEIVSFDASSATLKSGRSVSRREIRTAMRPAWQTIERWERTHEFQRLASAEASAVAAEQRARDLQTRASLPSSGPAHLLGPRID
jgi:hypothetical protein